MIRNAYGVSPAAKHRIQAAIEELGYRPQATARGMRGRTFTIGMVLPHIRNPFFADILDGLCEQLADTGYQPIMVQGGVTRKAEKQAVDALVDRQVDGIIMVAPLASKTRMEEVAQETPTVVLARHEKSTVYDSVFDDDDTGAEAVVTHLIELGHRRIAHITHQDNSIAQPDDLLHIIRARPTNASCASTGWATRSPSRPPSTTRRAATTGREAARPLPAPDRDLRRRRPGGDRRAGRGPRADLSVPGDVSIAGYDNTLLAALPNIALTSVNQDGVVMGRTAGRLLLERIEGRSGGALLRDPQTHHAPLNGPAAHVTF